MAASLYTLQQLDTAVLARLEDNSVFWPTLERYDIINEALRCSNVLCGWYQGTLQLISVAGQLVYPMPVGMLFPQRVQFNSVQLDPVPITTIGTDYRTWATDTSTNNGPVARWVPIGNNYFCIHPTDSIGGQTIFVTGVLETPLLVNPGDSMQLEDEYASIVVEYCASRLPLKTGGANALQALQLYQRSFLPQMKKLTSLQKMKFPRYFVNSGAPTTEGRVQ